MKILVLGAGAMVEAILSGLHGHIDLKSWGIYSPTGIKAKKLSEAYGLNWVKDLSVVKKNEFSWLMIGCKPQQLRDLSQTLPNELKVLPTISMLAALKEELQCKLLGTSKLIRIMPNLPVKYGTGVVLMSSSSAPENIQEVKSHLSSLGHIEIVNEEALEELTLLTGSGPALVYEFMAYLSDSFSSLNKQQREELAKLVLIGSAKSVQMSDDNFQTQIDSVTSKGGVTIEVLKFWRNHYMNDLVLNGVMAGKARASDITNALINDESL